MAFGLLFARPVSATTAGDYRTHSNFVFRPIDPPTPFEYRGHKGNAQLFGLSKPGPRLMRLGFHGPISLGAGGGIRIISRPVGQLVVNPEGWENVLLTEAEDAGFLTFAARSADLSPLRSQGFWECATRLRTLHDAAPVALTLRNHQVILEKLSDDIESRDYVRLTHQFLSLLDQLPVLAPPAEGLIEEGPAPVLDLTSATCEVCRNSLGWPVAVCTGCETPHHQDCWSFVGGCATFACLRRTCRIVDGQTDERLVAA